MPPGGRHQHSRSPQASPHRTEVRMEQGREGAGALPAARQQRMLVLAALKVNARRRRLKRLLRVPDDVDNLGRHIHAVNVKHDVRLDRYPPGGPGTTEVGETANAMTAVPEPDTASWHRWCPAAACHASARTCAGPDGRTRGASATIRVFPCTR